jgi:hypothetical protein
VLLPTPGLPAIRVVLPTNSPDPPNNLSNSELPNDLRLQSSITPSTLIEEEEVISDESLETDPLEED